MTATDQTTTETKRARAGRSPAYPGVTLKTALEKVESFYKQEGKYAAPMPSAFKAWGYSEKSSGGRELRAALRYYGLIQVEGDTDTGKVKITDDAYRYIMDKREDQSEKKELVRKLALSPAIHKKIVAKFPDGLKSRDTVIHYLIFEEHFNEVAAAELFNQFTATAAYADLFQPDTIVTLDAESKGSEAEDSGKGDQTGKHEHKPPPPDPSKGGKVTLMSGERVVFTEETNPQVYLKLVASGEVDDLLLEALEDFVKRQRKRIKASTGAAALGAAALDPPVQ